MKSTIDFVVSDFWGSHILRYFYANNLLAKSMLSLFISFYYLAFYWELDQNGTFIGNSTPKASGSASGHHHQRGIQLPSTRQALKNGPIEIPSDIQAGLFSTLTNDYLKDREQNYGLGFHIIDAETSKHIGTYLAPAECSNCVKIPIPAHLTSI